ncbi:MAG: hypothetical protein JNM63_13390 [Spirochaetia bacterium]|nr:hypothetical protein [Spirochaetia bacterium]
MSESKSNSGWAIFTLVVLSSVLTEIVSGNQPVHAYLNPKVAIFLTLAYGLPVLVIREVAVRFGVGPVGIFLMGLAYGFLNEGLLAQTIIREINVPINAFDHYMMAGGFNLSWTLVIVPWHAMHAILFPILLMGFWFPANAGTPWLGKKMFLSLSGILIGLVLFIGIVKKPHPQMIICLLVMAALVLISFLLRKDKSKDGTRNEKKFSSFFLGMAYYPFIFLGLIIAANKKIPAPLFALQAGVFFLILFFLLATTKLFLLSSGARLALGAYCAASLFQALSGLTKHSPEHLITGLLLALAFLILALLPERKRSGDQGGREAG